MNSAPSIVLSDGSPPSAPSSLSAIGRHSVWAFALRLLYRFSGKFPAEMTQITHQGLRAKLFDEHPDEGTQQQTVGVREGVDGVLRQGVNNVRLSSPGLQSAAADESLLFQSHEMCPDCVVGQPKVGCEVSNRAVLFA